LAGKGVAEPARVLLEQLKTGRTCCAVRCEKCNTDRASQQRSGCFVRFHRDCPSAVNAENT
jgi:hypothetical protein